MLMKKTSISTEGSNNRLSYLDNYEEIQKFRKNKREDGSSRFFKREGNPRTVKLSRRTRWVLFFLLFIIQILMNMDHGTIPAATDEIRNDLKIKDDVLGIFGSLVFFGNLIGTFYLFIRFNYFFHDDQLLQQEVYVNNFTPLELCVFVHFYRNRNYLDSIC